MKKLKLRQIWSTIWPYLFFIVVITIMIFPQLKASVLTLGGDTYFHYSRFYDAAMQIKHHNFSYFQTNYGFQQSGRVINALYGPFFAYLNGILILMVKNWFTYQIITDYLICLIGASSMFMLLRYVKVNKIFSALLSAIYINIGLIPTYINSGSFNSWGQAVMPFVLLCGVRMLSDHVQPIKSWQLMLVMSVVMQIHVLSTLMAILLLIPFFIIGVYYAQNRKKVWVSLLKAILGTICLTANVWGAYIVLLSKNKLATPDAYNLILSGLRVGSYQGYHGTYGTMFAFILPIILGVFLLQFLWVLFHLKDNLVNTVVTIYGVFLLAIASIYFPWGFVQRVFPFLQNAFQFPFRLTAIIYPMLILGIGLTIENYFIDLKPLRIATFLVIGLVLLESLGSVVRTTQCYTLNHIGNKEVQRYGKDKNLNKFFKTKAYGRQLDYLAISNNKNILLAKKQYKKDVVMKSKKFKHIVKSNKLILVWNGRNDKRIILPIVTYAQSQLKLNNQKFKGKKTVFGSPIVKQKEGKNVAVLSFNIPLYFRLLLIISIASWIIFIIYGFKFLIRRIHERQEILDIDI